MRILLDIDGVMVSAATWKLPEILNDGFTRFNNVAIESLRNIISETGASIVLTTSHKSNFSLYEWGNIFKNRGINTSIEKLDDNVNNLSRKDEILNWVDSNNNFEDFVIIDDDKSLNGLPDFLKNRLVLTSPMIGLNNDGGLSAIQILRSKELAA